MPDVNKLRGKMVEKSVTVDMLANALKLNVGTVYRRFQKPDTFTVGEVKVIADLLNLTVEDVEYIFH